MRIALLLLLAAALAGCFTTGRRGSETDMTTFDFGPSAPSIREARDKRADAALEIRAPLWMDGLGIRYRLSYADATQLREYARSRWAGPPARLVEQRLTQRLALTNAGRCVLRVELSEFSQTFASPQNSSGILQGKAVWLSPGRQSLAERPLSIASPAATANARGGVDALRNGVDRLADELLAWERELTATGRLRACFG
ncbi:MAG: PqiC family protein [Betaproteobacteria bacterium]|nr:PqiC family protein [Betaproteobacteria bacterium]MCL2887269.1 PqiC family protein [Betaproteobacteria bacterium]